MNQHSKGWADAEALACEADGAAPVELALVRLCLRAPQLLARPRFFGCRGETRAPETRARNAEQLLRARSRLFRRRLKRELAQVASCLFRYDLF